MKAALMVLLVALAGCTGSSNSEPATTSIESALTDVPVNETVNETAALPPLYLWDLQLPEVYLDSNRWFPWETDSLWAVKIKAAQQFNFNGVFNGYFALIPWGAWDSNGCLSDFTIRGTPGTSDSSVSTHSQGDYLMVGFAGDGQAYTSGFSSNEDLEATTMWLEVPGAATVTEQGETGTTTGLDASWAATLAAVAGTQTISHAWYYPTDDVLSPDYYAKVGEPEGTVSLSGCSDGAIGGSSALPALPRSLTTAQAGAVDANLSYARTFDQGSHAFRLLQVQFNDLA